MKPEQYATNRIKLEIKKICPTSCFAMDGYGEFHAFCIDTADRVKHFRMKFDKPEDQPLEAYVEQHVFAIQKELKTFLLQPYHEDREVCEA